MSWFDGVLDGLKRVFTDAWNDPKTDPRRSRNAMRFILKREYRPQRFDSVAPASDPAYHWVERSVAVAPIDMDILIEGFQTYLDTMILGSMQSHQDFIDHAGEIVKLYLKHEIGAEHEVHRELYYVQLMQFLEDMGFYDDFFEELDQNDDYNINAA
jgi:hypothetical protein